MDVGILLTLVGIVFAAAVAYHLAHLQGALRRPRLRIHIGASPAKHRWFHKATWAVLYGVPRRSAKFYSFPFPLLFENTGGAPLKNVWIQISYPTGRDASRVWDSAGAPRDNGLGRRRTTTPANERVFVEYEIPLIRPGHGEGLVDPVVYQDIELGQASSSGRNDVCQGEPSELSVVIDEIRFYVSAENYRPVSGRVWLLATHAKNIDELEALTPKAAEMLSIRARWRVITRSPGSWYWLPPPLWLWTRRILLHQIECDVLQEGVAIHIPGQSAPGVQQTADVLPIVVKTQPKC